MDWKEGLATDQINAAQHIGKHARLLAGPGTGKTRTLTRRILALVLEHNVNPEEILVLTFTRVAAYQLREEIYKVIEPLGKGIPRISTLHAFALRQLLLNSARITSLPKPLRVADDWEERYIIMENIRTDIGDHLGEILKEIHSPINKIRKLFNQMSSDWETLNIEADESERLCRDAKFIGAWVDHREMFGYIMRSELVYQLKNSIQIVPEFRLESQFSHVLIDEYQDLNSCDLSVIGQLAGFGAELYVAGDDDQSIYGFRFANPEGIREFPRLYSSKELNLEICYRCSKEVLNLANFIADLDTDREPKKTRPKDNAVNGEVRLLRFDDQYKEAKWIAQWCKEYLKENKDATILALMRQDPKNSISDPIFTALEMNDVETTSNVNYSPLDDNDGRQVLSLLRLLVNTDDDLAWYTILLLEYGIGNTTLQKIRNLSKAKSIRFFKAVEQIKSDTKLKISSVLRIKIEEIYKYIEEHTSDERPIATIIDDVINRYCRDQDRKIIIANYFNQIIKESNSETISDLFTAISASIENAEQHLVKGKVNIMTMHRAKGLSSDIVFIVGAEDEFIPGKNADKNVGDERRLFYVSLTRARNFLYISVCKHRRGFQRHFGSRSGKVFRHITRFLEHSPLKIEDINM